MTVAAATVQVWSDIGCPWATAALLRLYAARERLGLATEITVDHRAFPLELVNGQPTPRHILDAEIPVVGRLAPDFGWSVWRGPAEHYPVTTLIGLEAVQAAKAQGLHVSEQVDMSLRRALFVDSRCISIRAEVERAVRACPDVHADALLADLDSGRARADVTEQWRVAESDHIQGSPHLFLADGTSVHNPGITKHWSDEPGRGFPVIDHDDPTVYDALLRRAAG
ncbi:MAG: DsbA family protein [Actinobacteria bacterium]|nr:DsbA family protein [Actinomycetota bacterium]